MEQRFAPIFVNLKSNTYENHDTKVAIVNQFSKLNDKKFFIKIKKKPHSHEWGFCISGLLQEISQPT